MIAMILADKIVELRKKAGLSQEELAHELGVSRQAVSKWEGAQSTPDMSKVVALSELFGVSTDYLLKDSVESPGDVPPEDDGTLRAGDGEELRPVDMQTANRFLANNERNATLVAFGVMLCICSPIALVVLSAGSDVGALPLTEDQAIPTGLATLLVLVAIAVAIFVSRGMRSREFEYLKNDSLDTAYGVDGMVRERKARRESAHVRDIVIGIVLCVAACAPVFVATVFDAGDDWATTLGVAALLFLIGVGVFLIVRSTTIQNGFDVLLEEGGYTREGKRVARRIGGLYWGIVLALYLVVSFLTMRWDVTWIVWPIAAVLYGVVVQVCKSRAR